MEYAYFLVESGTWAKIDKLERIQKRSMHSVGQMVHIGTLKFAEPLSG